MHSKQNVNFFYLDSNNDILVHENHNKDQILSWSMPKYFSTMLENLGIDYFAIHRHCIIRGQQEK